MKDTTIVPPGHRGFRAQALLLTRSGNSLDCFLADIDPGGGGPDPAHTHEHGHVFIVLEGDVTVRRGDEEIRLKPVEALEVDGRQVHAMWNRGATAARVIGIHLP